MSEYTKHLVPRPELRERIIDTAVEAFSAHGIKSILILVYNNRIKWRRINIYFKKYTFFESYLLEFYLKPPASE